MKSTSSPDDPGRRWFLRAAGGAAVGAFVTVTTARPAFAADSNSQGVATPLIPTTVIDSALALESSPGSGALPAASGGPGGQNFDLFQARAWVTNDAGGVVKTNRVFYLNEKAEMRITAFRGDSVAARIKQANFGTPHTADLLQFADVANTTVLSMVSADGSFRAGPNGTSLIGSKYLSSQTAAPPIGGLPRAGDVAVGPKGLWIHDGAWHFLRQGPDVLAVTNYSPPALESAFTTSATSAVCVETNTVTPPTTGNTTVQFVAPAFVQKVLVHLTGLARVTNPSPGMPPPRLYFNLRSSSAVVAGAVGIVTECPSYVRVNHDVVVDLLTNNIFPGDTVTWHWAFRVQNATDVGSIYYGASPGMSAGCPMTMTVTAVKMVLAAG